MKNNRVLVIGASSSPERYSYKAAVALMEQGFEVVLLGKKAGYVHDVPIHTNAEHFANIDTVTIYVAPQNQQEIEDYIISLSPRRVIFNPGTENAAFARKLTEHGIEVIEHCTLVMLANHSF